MDEKEKTEKMVRIMACSVMGIGFAYLFLVTFLTIPPSGTEHAKTITGFMLGVAVATLISYYWGSSKGSAAKSEAIEKKLDETKLSSPIKPEVIEEEKKP
jgi:hypothetical protein